MRQTRSVEIGTGLFVLLGMSSLFFLTTQTTGGDDFKADSVYTVEARFENIGSLRERAPVTMSGVTIGRVTDVGATAAGGVRLEYESPEGVVHSEHDFVAN